MSCERSVFTTRLNKLSIRFKGSHDISSSLLSSFVFHTIQWKMYIQMFAFCKHFTYVTEPDDCVVCVTHCKASSYNKREPWP